MHIIGLDGSHQDAARSTCTCGTPPSFARGTRRAAHIEDGLVPARVGADKGPDNYGRVIWGPNILALEARRARTAQGRSTGGSALGVAGATRTNLAQLSCERLRAIDLARHWVLSATSMKTHDSRQLLPGAQRHIELPRRVTVGLLLLGSLSWSEPMRERAPA